MSITSYAAFLRGVNSGRNPTIKMDLLRKAFEDMGFQNVKTILASGNVLFEAEAANENSLEQKIEKMLPKFTGFEAAAMIYSLDDLRRLVEADPFKDIEAKPETRRYVTFLKERAKKGPNSGGKGFKVLAIKGRAIFSVVDLAEAKTPDLMKWLDHEFGKNNTTRDWNTIEKVYDESIRKKRKE